MSIVLVVLGITCVMAGFIMVIANKANDRAGGSGLGKFSIEGPTWLVLVAIGIAASGWGVVRWEDRNPPKPQPAAITAPEQFTLQDDNDLPDIFDYGDDAYLDGLWDDCTRGIWKQCDELYFDSPEGSEYEWFGATCGWIVDDPIEFCSPSNN